MLLHVISDLHIEFASFEPPKTDADIVILAGDVGCGFQGLEWAMHYFPDKPVLYILGNHEYYGHRIPGLIGDLRSRSIGTNVFVMESGEASIDGVRFLGCTLWTDFNLFGNAGSAIGEALRGMSDYELIRHSNSGIKLHPIYTRDLFMDSKKWLEEKFNDSCVGKTIVITHHAPSGKSILGKYSRDILNAAFASGLDSLVAKSHADVWIHGHTHSVFDYELGSTRVLCNPRGYPKEDVGNFNPGLVVEI